MSYIFLLFVLLSVQDETEYNLAVEEMRFMVRNFKEPEDGVVIRPAAYWERAVKVTREIERFRPTATRELYAAQQLFAGMLSLIKGNAREAAAEFQHGLRLEPNEAAMFHYALGLAASMERRSSVAEGEFKVASEKAEHWAAPRIALAAMYLDSNRIQDAETLLKRSIDLGLTDVDAIKSRQYFLLAKILDAQKKIRDAEATLRTAIDLDTANPMLADCLGILLLKSGRRQQALDAWRMASKEFQNNSMLTREIALTEDGVSIAGAPSLTGPTKGSITLSSPPLPGGSRYRAYRIQANLGDVLKFRADSRAFVPFMALLGTDGKAVAMQDIRSSYFSVLEYTVAAPGTYHLVVSTYSPGQIGEFELSDR